MSLLEGEFATCPNQKEFFLNSWNKNCYSKIKSWGDLYNSKVYGEWKNISNKQPFGSLPTNDEMAKSVLSRVEDRGFFDDCLDWLKSHAPRKIRVFLKGLCPSDSPARVTYDDLCRAVYNLGFRTSEILERRMILGPANRWVQDYFKDFPRREGR
jgi:hypothetical protein